MTSATEKLRRMLDERGVKTYHEQNYITWRDANDYQCFAFETYERPGLLRVHCNLTPEQAIAATLWNGTLTAEQVMVIAGKHQPDYCSDTHACFDWQAIADELNAKLGGDTCENIAPDYLDFLCNKCGFVHYHSDENDTGDGNDWNYCPNCGRKVVSA